MVYLHSSNSDGIKNCRSPLGSRNSAINAEVSTTASVGASQSSTMSPPSRSTSRSISTIRSDTSSAKTSTIRSSSSNGGGGGGKKPFIRSDAASAWAKDVTTRTSKCKSALPIRGTTTRKSNSTRSIMTARNQNQNSHTDKGLLAAKNASTGGMVKVKGVKPRTGHVRQRERQRQSPPQHPSFIDATAASSYASSSLSSSRQQTRNITTTSHAIGRKSREGKSNAKSMPSKSHEFRSKTRTGPATGSVSSPLSTLSPDAPEESERSSSNGNSSSKILHRDVNININTSHRHRYLATEHANISNTIYPTGIAISSSTSTLSNDTSSPISLGSLHTVSTSSTNSISVDKEKKHVRANANEHAIEHESASSKSKSKSSSGRPSPSVSLHSHVKEKLGEKGRQQEQHQHRSALRAFIANERMARQTEKAMISLHHQMDAEHMGRVMNAPVDIISNNGVGVGVGVGVSVGTSICTTKVERTTSTTATSTISPTDLATSACDGNANGELNTSGETQYEGPPNMDYDDDGFRSPISALIRNKKDGARRFQNKTTNEGLLVTESTGTSCPPPIQTDVMNNASSGSASASAFARPHQYLNFHQVSSPRTPGGCSFFVNVDVEEPKVTHDTSVPCVHLCTFAESLWLDFGKEKMNIVGKSRSLPFELLLPKSSTKEYVTLTLEKVPSKKGFIMMKDKGNGSEPEVMKKLKTFTIQRGETQRFVLQWTPTAPGGVCEVVYLKLPRGRVRVTARGHAQLEKKKKVSKASIKRISPQVTFNSRSSNHTPHELQNVVKDTYSSNKSWHRYDDKSSEKQCDAYAQLLNHIFKGLNSTNEAESKKGNGSGLGNFLVDRRKARISNIAKSLLHVPEIKWMLSSIDHQINMKHLSIRSDHDVFVNVSLRNQIFSMIFSYSTPWLKLGLETIFDEDISIDSISGSLKAQSDARESLGIQVEASKKPSTKAVLKNFIAERVLSDPQIKMRFTGGKCQVLSGRFEKKYRELRNQHALRTLLRLVLFLDVAKTSDIFDPPIRLFNKRAFIKSSRAFLDVLSRDYMHGVGNIAKHLAQVGVTVSYEQNHLEELDFQVTNLASDLRDGVRLGKLTELLGGGSQRILHQMRLPAVSRLQKVFNVGVVISSLSAIGVRTGDIHPNYIVDGHKPQVLRLLWSIISSFSFNALLSRSKLRHEIQAITSSNFSEICGNIEFCEDICDLLLGWCHAICSIFGHPVTNFSSAFANGKAICYLIHYYHPHILKLDRILPTTNAPDNIENEHKNCALACETMAEIGGIPNMYPIVDSCNPPDERSTIVCTTFLCARLLESSRERLAATVIQRMFRRFQKRLQTRSLSRVVSRIELFWLRHKDQYYANMRALYLPSVRKLELFLIRYRHKIEMLKKDRLFREKVQHETATNAACSLQSFWRRVSCEQSYNSQRKGYTMLQNIARKRFAIQRLAHLQVRKASVIKCQSIVRTFLVLRKYTPLFKLRNEALRKIQSTARLFLRRGTFIEIQKERQVQALLYPNEEETEEQYNCESTRKRCRGVKRGQSSDEFCKNVPALLARTPGIQTASQTKPPTVSLVETRHILEQNQGIADQETLDVNVTDILFNAPIRTREIQSATHTEALSCSSQKFGHCHEQGQDVDVDDDQKGFTHDAALFFTGRFTACNGIRQTQVMLSQADSSTPTPYLHEQSHQIVIDQDSPIDEKTNNHCESPTASSNTDVNQSASQSKPLLSFSRESGHTHMQSKHFYNDHSLGGDNSNAVYEKSVDKIEIASKVDRLLSSSQERTHIHKSSQYADADREACDRINNISENCTASGKTHEIQSEGQTKPFHKDWKIHEQNQHVLYDQKSLPNDMSNAVCENLPETARISVIQNASQTEAFMPVSNGSKHIPDKSQYDKDEIESRVEGNANARYKSTNPTRIRCGSDFPPSDQVSCLMSNSQTKIYSDIAGTGANIHAIREFATNLSEVHNLESSLQVSFDRKNTDLQWHSATLIQSAWRSFSAHLQYCFDLSDIVFIQSLSRKRLALKKAQVRKNAVATLQKSCRIWMVQKRSQNIDKGRKDIQKSHSIFLSEFQQRTGNRQDESSIAAATSSTPNSNSNLQMSHNSIIRDRNGAALIIQKYWRGYVINIDYFMTLHQIVRVQSFVRRLIVKRMMKERFRFAASLEIVTSTIVKSKVSNQRDTSSAIIQKWWKGTRIKSLASEPLKMPTRPKHGIRNRAAIDIQRIWRGYSVNIDYLLQINTKPVSMVKQESTHQKSRHSQYTSPITSSGTSLLISKCNEGEQRLVDAPLSKLPIDQRKGKALSQTDQQERSRPVEAESFRSRDKELNIREDFSREGFNVKQKKDKEAEPTIKTSISPDNILLPSDINEALCILQSSSSRLIDVTAAIKRIETITRPPSSICAILVEANTHTVLYDLMRSCNRSQPHIQLLKYTLQILSNISEDTNLASTFANKHFVDIFIDLIQMFRDKVDIVTFAAQLLRKIILVDPKSLKRCSKRENIKRLKGIHTLFERELRRHRKAFEALEMEKAERIRVLLELILEECSKYK